MMSDIHKLQHRFKYYLLDTSETCSRPHLANTEINFVLDKTTTCLSIPGNTLPESGMNRNPGEAMMPCCVCVCGHNHFCVIDIMWQIQVTQHG